MNIKRIIIGISIIINCLPFIAIAEEQPQVIINVLRGELKQAHYEYGKLSELFVIVRQENEKMKEWKKEIDQKEQKKKELNAPAKQEAPQ